MLIHQAYNSPLNHHVPRHETIHGPVQSIALVNALMLLIAEYKVVLTVLDIAPEDY